MNNYYPIDELYKLYKACQQKITTDTRKLEKGAIFFALKGENFNANTFAHKAIEEGCAYAIVDDSGLANGTTILLVRDVLESLQQLAKLHRKQLKIPVIGITGSNGKTTNKELIHAVLSQKYNTYATKGNLNNHIGVPLTILSITDKHEMAIIEMGANHQGEIELLSSIADPDFGIITNIGKAHLEGFGGEEGIKKGKSELYKHIKQKQGSIFINGDDRVLLELSEGINKFYYGNNERFDVHGQNLSTSEYVEFKWNVKNLGLNAQPLVKTHIFGYYNFINLLCAACIGNHFNVPENDVNKALSEYMPEMNRSQVKKTETNTLILDAYNANPSSMSLAIEHFMKQPFDNKWVILGDMLELGIYTEREHREILEQLSEQNAIQVILIGEHFFKLKLNYTQNKNYLFFETIELAKHYLYKNRVTSSTLLIKGSRGIKLESLIGFL